MYNRAQIDRGGNYVSQQGPGDSVLDQTQVFPITTVGAGTLTAAALLAGIIERTGPVAGYNDTLETADNLMAANPALTPGDSWEFIHRNTVAQAMTMVAAEGAELVGSNTGIIASAVRRYLITILANGRRQVFAANTVNGNAVLTGFTAAQMLLMTPGMGVSGTGITGGTTVIGVNISGRTVTLSANATATGLNALTFFPRYNVRGLASMSL
jgi:hypothetical protein